MSFANIFTPKDDKVLFAKVIQKNSNTSCTVRDTRGRLFLVESNGTYSIGQSVSVKSGVIIGRTKAQKTVTHFNV